MVNFGAIGTGATVAITIKAIDDFSKTFKSADNGLAKIGKVGATAALAVAAGVASLGVAAVKLAGDFEQTTVAFTTMLGSGEEAKVFLEELADFAKKTPFTLPGVEKSAKQLLAVGFEAEEILPILKSVGDVSAGLGMGEEGLERLILNLGQVRTQGKLTGRELRDFSVAGVPMIDMLREMAMAGEISGINLNGIGERTSKTSEEIEKISGKLQVATLRLQEMSEAGKQGTASFLSAELRVQSLKTELSAASSVMPAVGMSIENVNEQLDDLISSGKISSEVVEKAFHSMAEEGGKFANLMEKQSETVQGRFSNLKDTVTLLGREMGTALLPVVGELANTFLNDVLPSLMPVIEAIGVFLQKALEKLAPFLPKIADMFGDMVVVVLELFDAVEPLLEPLFEIGAILFPIILDVIKSLTPVVKILAEALVPLLELLVPIVELLGFVLKGVASLSGKAFEKFFGATPAGLISSGSEKLSSRISRSDLVSSGPTNAERIFLPENNGNTTIFNIDKIQGVDADEITELMSTRLSLEIRR